MCPGGLSRNGGRVFLNLLNKAFYAVHQRRLSQNGAYTPTVTVSTHRAEDTVEIRIEDNGTGIADGLKEKIFEPFFTMTLLFLVHP